MTSTRYKVALIGLGRIASTIDDEIVGYPGALLPYAHMACYREVPSVEVVAGADLFDEQRESFRQRWGVERLYADYREMLEREKPDIVSVTTTARARAAIVLDCARAGARLIYAEKPIAISLAEADAMVDTCRSNGVKLAVGCTRRWDPYYTRVREMVREGAIGRVLQVTGYCEAGISINGSHWLDTLRMLAGGDARWVFGEMESDEKAATDDDLMGNGYVAFDNGARGFIRMLPAGGSVEWEVVGETGRIRLHGDRRAFEWWQIRGEGREREAIERLFPMPQRLHSANVRAVQDFVRCLETGKDPECTGEDGRAALETAIAMRESHRQGGRRIDLPLADRSLRILSAESTRGDLPAALRRRQAAAQGR